MKHALEGLLARGIAGCAAAVPGAFGRGAALGDLARSLGIRRAVAADNLARAFPDRSEAERETILIEHYRELGRVAWEYPRLAKLAAAQDGHVVAEAHGLEHLDAARSAGRGAILLTGHFGNFELLGAWLAKRHPMDFVVKGLSNPRVEAMLTGWRRDAGVGSIPIGVGARRIFSALRSNRWVAMVADQDARRDGVFVPFFGTPSSTAAGPAAIALRSGAPIIMGFAFRRPDGRHELTMLPPLPIPESRRPDAVHALTAAHTAVLEEWVRRHPAMWFWVHKRWKTVPPAGGPRNEE